MKNKFVQIIALMLAFLMLASLVSCSTQNADPSETTGEAAGGSSEAVSEKNAESSEPEKEDELRVIISSDVHHTNIRKWYGVDSTVRMQKWVEAIKAEHEKKPIDLLIIAGDTSLDHLADEGTYTTSNVSTTRTFVNNYVSQLPDEIPVFILPGNHEQYSNAQWKALTGNDRCGTIEIKGNLFIMLDNYNSNLEPNRKGDPSYTLSDVNYIKEQMAAHPECENVWLVGHHFDHSGESTEFKNLVKDDDRIKGLFSGHTHKCNVINMGDDYGDKKLAQTGQFSYSYYTAYPTGKAEDVTKTFWGFRDLTVTAQSAVSRYIIPQSDNVTIENSRITVQRQIVDTVKFY